mmetsp:Transcript_30763/g.46653  ORF Transcript_30763/g.46653 Transcript_30763/m.46653 type:complete len:537 (+) Transcript_30763:109-1719(+)|eukprot:CAMPEP_0178896944 /NCGR_PEP_ID=MMETSP0786-20121207/1467_1 /TAXON_ID=186022 /ORGANISM="Thalassionema frauenfeldii, Strain CCMP 1798" /LENGTH=536 /DNA_ID=CAMNT_0020567429 /DNA_START=20 /DNA_END=1630 /DNA_ORIENTATION=+
MGLLIVSWNVAGLSTTVQRIHNAYKAEEEAKSTTALEFFFNKHGGDIFCLQEHKIPQKQLSSRGEPHQCATLHGYESFWSPTTASGMNGVVTYAKKGLTKSANASPLGIPDLDKQGRCISTDHGSFVIFNVYAPCNGGHSVHDKMKFLHALRSAMRATKKPVILLGDLNITHTPLDKFWKDRIVMVNSILNQPSETSSWHSDVVEAWPKIKKALMTSEVKEVQTTNPTTGAKFQKYRLQCISSDGKKIFLGGYESKPEYCLYHYNMEKSFFECPETGEKRLTCAENTLSLETLTELMNKLGGINWSESDQRKVASEVDGVCPHHPARKWLDTLICRHDKMIDVFRHFYPKAEGRFTCWDQFKNRRYENEGCRIDYIWVDAALLQYVQKGDGGLQLGENDTLNQESEEAALEAATCGGRYKPVSFQGGGIVDVSRTILDKQFAHPHTGMIYTPPSFSDHIAVSLFLDLSPEQSGLENDKETKRAQPHKLQQSIATFFTAPLGKNSEEKKRGTVASRFPQKKLNKKPKTMLHHFGIKE